jgi:dTMP kinase
MFITFEGIDGSGKSIQLERLRQALSDEGRDVHVTREPGGSPLGRHIRPILVDLKKGEGLSDRTELLLYLADRAQHVHEVIAPVLARGGTVLCDRFLDSTMAYQGYGRGLDTAWLATMNDFTTGCLRPDLTLLFDLPPETGLARARGRNQRAGQAGDSGTEGRFEALAMDFHTRVRDGYLALARAEPDRFRVVDAARGIDEVAAHVRRIIVGKGLLPAPGMPGRQDHMKP